MNDLKSLELYDKKVLLRVDFNVPLNENLEITSTKRIDSAVPTISYLKDKGAKIILCSHLGRPKGKCVSNLSLYPIFLYLQKIYGEANVFFSHDSIGKSVEDLKANLKSGQILLLENLRFNSGEEECNDTFAKELAKNIDIFVDDAFAVSHRKCASNFGVSQLLPSYFGFLMLKERRALSFKDKEKPILAILGGAKVSDKIKLISNLIDKVNAIFVGGAMSYTFLKALGYEVGLSLVDDELLNMTLDIINKAKTKNVELILPIDAITSSSMEDEKNAKLKFISNFSKTDMGLDIGNKTIKILISKIKNSKTVFWNGPLGVYNKKAFEKGTKKIANVLANCKAYTIVGGGDSVDALDKYKLEEKINFVSTGGGASLKYIQDN